jgi:hypothetical protein
MPVSEEDGHSMFDIVFNFCSIRCGIEAYSLSMLNQSPIPVAITVSNFIRRAIIDPDETTRGGGFQ